ncbi:MAG: hypothetical protein GX987_10305 [Tissierellia bacterium]|nr:hypothetical protein [Tissierellia bacterium]
MIELYNDNNIKVYVDDERYILGDVSNPRYLKITTPPADSNYLRILLDKPFITSCTVTIKGNTVTINGTSNHQEVALQLYLGKYNATLKGNLTIKVYNGENKGYSVYTLYDETCVYQIADMQRINDKVDFILKDKSIIQTADFAQSMTAYLYDSSVFRLYMGEAKIYAYDSSQVKASALVTKLEVDAYDNVKVEAGEDVDVVINDESKLVRF